MGSWNKVFYYKVMELTLSCIRIQERLSIKGRLEFEWALSQWPISFQKVKVRVVWYEWKPAVHQKKGEHCFGTECIQCISLSLFITSHCHSNRLFILMWGGILAHWLPSTETSSATYYQRFQFCLLPNIAVVSVVLLNLSSILPTFISGYTEAVDD